MKKMLLLSLVALVTVFQFCHSSKKATTETAGVSYRHQVQPLIQQNCSPCHFPPQGRAEALNSYQAAKGHINEILSRINRNPDQKGFMPMRHPKLPDSTLAIFARWKESGLAE